MPSVKPIRRFALTLLVLLPICLSLISKRRPPVYEILAPSLSSLETAEPVNCAKINPKFMAWSDFSPNHEPLCDHRTTSFSSFLAEEQSHWWFSKCLLFKFNRFMRLWRILFYIFFLLVPHIASESFRLILHAGLCVYASIPEDWEILHMCVPCIRLHYPWGGGSHGATAYKGWFLDSDASASKLHVCCHVSLNVNASCTHTTADCGSQ